jgi:hypothetical protein
MERVERFLEEDPEEEGYCSSLGLCKCLVCAVFDSLVRFAFRLCKLLHLYRLAERIDYWSFMIYSKYCVPHVSEEEQREIDEILKGRDFEYGEPMPLEEFLKKLEEEEKKSQ